MKTPLLIVLIVFTINGCMYGQSVTPQVINICGGSYTQGYYNIDWSVGELALVDQMQTADGSNITTHGFLQPNTDHPGTIYVGATFNDDEVMILPNPTRDVLEVNYLSSAHGPVVFTIYDAVGRPLYKKEFSSTGIGFIEKINMTRFPGGAYMLFISATSNDPGVPNKKRAYKIIKLN